METNKSILSMSKQVFSYLVRIKIGPKNFSMLIRNHKEVPDKIIETMTKEKITSYINETYLENKHYRNQTSEAYFNKMIKDSSYEIENLNSIDVYDLQLNFTDKNEITNNENGKQTIKQSSINKLIL